VTLFILIAALFGSVSLGTLVSDKASFAPGLALDLVGGTQLILQPVAVDSTQRPSAESLSQAVAIIRQRVDASGVAEAEISSEGSGNIVVGIPGNPSQEDLNLVSKSAKMTFRTVLREEQAAAQSPSAWLTRQYPAPPGDEMGAASDGEEAAGDDAVSNEVTIEDPAGEEPAGDGAAGDEGTSDDALSGDAAMAGAEIVAGVHATADDPAGEEPAGDPAGAPEGEVPLEDPAGDGAGEPLDIQDISLDETGAVVDDSATTPAGPPPSVPPIEELDSRLEVATDEALITPEMEERFTNIDCSTVGSDVTGEPSDSDEVLVTCSENMGTPEQPAYMKYILGPVMVEGSELSNASSGLSTNSQGQTTGEWVVNLQLKTAGARQFAAVSSKLVDLDQPRNQFAIVLDDRVVSAPRINSAIPDGRAEISGSFTQGSSKTLADQLSFGSLPLNFTVMSQEQVSATLGSEQLRNGLIAGVIGLILVAIYSFMQYRALSLVTILSLIAATGLTYGALLLLSWVQGYRLSLAGVAGIIVSIGVTADSFIVYFERIRDELRDGRPLGHAVDLAWLRARRTIIASDAVNFIAAGVLYFVSVGSVRGFAFTLGLTTLMDLVIVMMFTHPMILLLAKLPFWANGHPWSGMDPYRLGAPGSVHYAGRGRITRVPEKVPVGVGARSKPATPTAGVTAPARERVAIPAGTPGQSIAERKAAAKAARQAETEAIADEVREHVDEEEDS
jgi:preprotein translocase subunit SecD